MTESAVLSSEGAIATRIHRSRRRALEPNLRPHAAELEMAPRKATRPPGQRRPRLLGCPVGRRTTCPTPTGQPVAQSRCDALGDTPCNPSGVEFTAIFC